MVCACDLPNKKKSYWNSPKCVYATAFKAYNVYRLLSFFLCLFFTCYDDDGGGRGVVIAAISAALINSYLHLFFSSKFKFTCLSVGRFLFVSRYDLLFLLQRVPLLYGCFSVIVASHHFLLLLLLRSTDSALLPSVFCHLLAIRFLCI